MIICQCNFILLLNKSLPYCVSAFQNIVCYNVLNVPKLLNITYKMKTKFFQYNKPINFITRQLAVTKKASFIFPPEITKTLSIFTLVCLISITLSTDSCYRRLNALKVLNLMR